MCVRQVHHVLICSVDGVIARCIHVADVINFDVTFLALAVLEWVMADHVDKLPITSCGGLALAPIAVLYCVYRWISG